MPCPRAVSSKPQGSRRLLLWTHASYSLALAQGTEKPFTSLFLQSSWLCAGIWSPILQMRTLSLREEAEIPLLQDEQGSKPKSVRLQSPLQEISVVVQSLSCVRLFVTPWTAACQASLSFTISQSLLKLRSIESVTPSNHLILCLPLLLLPSIFPSIRVFSNELSLCIRWPNYWSFSFSISPSNEYSGLISFRIDWVDLAIQGKSWKPLEMIRAQDNTRMCNF